jgi:hypothetical protein
VLLTNEIGLRGNPEAAPKRLVHVWSGRRSIGYLREGKPWRQKEESKNNSQRLPWFDMACSDVNLFNRRGSLFIES